MPYYLETPYHRAGLRPRTDNTKYLKELRLKVLEWDLLEYLIIASDAEWEPTSWETRFQRFKGGARKLEKNIAYRATKAETQGEVRHANHLLKSRRALNARAVRVEKEEWLKTVKETCLTPANGAVVEDEHQRYTREIAQALVKPVKKETPPASTEVQVSEPQTAGKTVRTMKQRSTSASLMLADAAGRIVDTRPRRAAAAQSAGTFANGGESSVWASFDDYELPQDVDPPEHEEHPLYVPNAYVKRTLKRTISVDESTTAWRAEARQGSAGVPSAPPPQRRRRRSDPL